MGRGEDVDVEGPEGMVVEVLPLGGADFALVEGVVEVTLAGKGLVCGSSGNNTCF